MGTDEKQFDSLLELLKETRGFDFTGYKRSSLMRRVGRRMQQLGVGSYGEYIDHLQVHPDEYTTLFNTVLINVTDFFRDEEAWRRLRTDIVPQLLAGKKPTEQIRVWCAGCATGEEAYSIAMILSEELGRDDFRARVKIYATDIDEEALSIARQATYQPMEVRGVPADLLDKYFDYDGERYSFTKDLRRVVIFGRNDLVQDAPISRVDLLACRNTLMYLNAETQTRVLARFNFALNPTGVLFLGKAEMLLSHRQLFTPIDLKRRLFRKVPRVIPGLGSSSEYANGSFTALRDLTDVEGLQVEALRASPIATVVLTPDGLVGAVNQRAELMLGASMRDIGRPFMELDVSYRPIELRPYLDDVRRDRRAALVQDIEFSRPPAEPVYLDIHLVPLVGLDGLDSGTVLFFSDVTRQHTLQQELEFANRQVEMAYEELQSTVEELETTNEELQSTVEELETTNEELQSTNEELETMNEELQSTNDELQSINNALRQRTDEVNDANNFLESILRSLRSAVIVLDADLRVRVWNRCAEDLWGLRAEECVGQHFLNLDIGLPTDQLRPAIRRTLSSGDGPEEVTLQAVNRRGRTIEVRVVCRPLAGRNGDTVAGVILVVDHLEPLASASSGSMDA